MGKGVKVILLVEIHSNALFQWMILIVANVIVTLTCEYHTNFVSEIL